MHRLLVFVFMMLIASTRCKIPGTFQQDRLNAHGPNAKSSAYPALNIDSNECNRLDTNCNAPPADFHSRNTKIEVSENMGTDTTYEKRYSVLKKRIHGQRKSLQQSPMDTQESLLGTMHVLQHLSSLNWNSNGNIQNSASTSNFAVPSSSTVEFFPASLNFQDRPICLLSAKTVDVINHSPDQELQILSISSDSIYFYPSFFRQPIPPGGNGSLTVMFLPRSFGSVENSMVIQTNIGSFVYTVSGTGHANAYKVKPHVGIKLFPKMLYNQSLEIYNPHPETLEITEVFTSGGFLQLTLPSSDKQQASNVLWNIEPFQRRRIIQMTFASHLPGKYQSFVNIKSNKENLVIPVDITVFRDGLHILPEELDFGTLTSQHDIAVLNISVINAEPHPVAVQNITFDSYTDSTIKGIRISTPNNVVIPPLTETPFQIGHVALLGAIEGKLRGKLVLHTNFTTSTDVTVNTISKGSSSISHGSTNHISNPKIEIPAKGRVVFGNLSYAEINTTFPVVFSSRRNCKLLTPQEQAIFEPKLLPVSRLLALTNQFNVPVTIYSAEVESNNFKILVNSKGPTPIPLSLALPYTISPGSSWSGLLLSFLANTTDMSFTTQLILETNASSVAIPIICYHGLLHYSIQESNILQYSPPTKIGCIDRSLHIGINFGLIERADSESRTFTIHNLNPVKIPINSIKVIFPSNFEDLKLIMKLDSIRDGQGNADTVNPNSFSFQSNDTRVTESGTVLELGPAQSATFIVQISPIREHHISGQIVIQTPFELTSIPINVEWVGGSMSAVSQLITFDEPAFPGKSMTVELNVNSTFKHPIQITSIVSSDKRIIPIMDSDVVAILPNQISHVGSIVFDPMEGAVSDLPHSSGILPQARLTNYDLKTQVQMLKRWELYWNRLHAENLDTIEATITLKSDATGSTDFALTVPVRAVLQKPSILPPSKRSVQFPKVQIGEETSEEILVENPADIPVSLQILPILDASTCFFVDSSVGSEGVITLQPKAQRIIGQIIFRPNSLGVCESFLFIKNNLSVIEPLGLSGMGGSGKLVLRDFGEEQNRLSENLDHKALLFPVGNHAQRLCKKTGFSSYQETGEVSKDSDSSVTVTKHITALNIGDLPVHVQSIMIDDKPCEGYGFWVNLDKHVPQPHEAAGSKCGAITLYPWESQNLTIFYSPQLASSLQSRTLVLNTVQGTLSYSLDVVIPNEYLPLCSNTRQQHEFDSILHKILVTVIFGILVMLSAFGLREYQCFGERYLVKPLQVAVVAKESIPFEYSDTSLALSLDSEPDLDQNIDKEKEFLFPSIHNKSGVDLDSHSSDGTLAHHIVSTPSPANYASPNSGDHAQPHVRNTPVSQPSKLKEKRPPAAAPQIPSAPTSPPKVVEEKKKQIIPSANQTNSKPSEDKKTTSSIQQSAAPVTDSIKQPTVQDLNSRKKTGKKEFSSNNAEKSIPNPPRTKPPQEPSQPKLETIVPTADKKVQKQKLSHTNTEPNLSKKSSSPNSDQSEPEDHSEDDVKLTPIFQTPQVPTDSLREETKSEVLVQDSNWTPSWLWDYSNQQQTTNDLRQHPHTAVSCEKLENGIGSMDTTNDLRCYSPKRPAIGVIGSGKQRENIRRKEHEHSLNPPSFSSQQTSNINMDMMFENTRILNSTSEPLDAWGQLADVPSHTNVSPTSLSMVWPSNMQPHIVTTTPYTRSQYSTPMEPQSHQFGGFQSADLYNTSSLFSSFTPLTMNLGSFHQINPAFESQIIRNSPENELDQEIDPNLLQFQFDSQEFLQ